MSDERKDDLNEKEIWAGGYSIQALWSSFVILGVLALIAAIILFLAKPFGNLVTAWTIFSIAFGCCALAMYFVYLYQRLNRWFILTNERIKHHEGVLTRSHYVLELIRVNDVTFDQGPIEAMLGCGTIYVHSSDPSHPELVLNGIQNVREVADLIDKSRREERRMRGVHVESI